VVLPTRICKNYPVATKQPDRTSRFLLACGSAAGPLFVATYSISGRRLIARGYDPRRDPVSMIVRVPGGGTQTANFLATGVLLCASAVGARRALVAEGATIIGTSSIPVCIWAVGIGLIGAGVFPTDVIDAKERGADPEEPQKLRLAGALHNACAVPVFTGLPIACFICARRFGSTGCKGLSRLALLSGLSSIAASTVHGWSYGEVRRGETSRLVRHSGTFQRVALVTGLGYLSAFLSRLVLSLSDDSGHVSLRNGRTSND
jgi:Protein of unknown function (DUF998)